MSVKFIFFCRLFKASVDSITHDNHEYHFYYLTFDVCIKNYLFKNVEWNNHTK